MRLAVRKRREVTERRRRENTMNMELGNTNRSKIIERRINVMRGEGHSYRKDTELGLEKSYFSRRERIVSAAVVRVSGSRDIIAIAGVTERRRECETEKVLV